MRDETQCKKCGEYYALREGNEPTPFCDVCAHIEVERLSALVAKLRRKVKKLKTDI